MKRFYILCLAILATASTYAQTTDVKGVILDSQTKAGEPSAIIQFFRADDLSKPIAFTTTDQEGNFTQSLTDKGDYMLMFSNMGRKQFNILFTLSGQQVLDLGEILVEDDIQTLKAGTVTAQKTLVIMEVDKLTYKVEDDVDAKTSTVLDMLRKVPMVSVDGMDNITVNGSSNFQVYVDGKPNPMMSAAPAQIFKSMPASFVRNIEVITNPGAKYDAEGVGGVLNITTATNAGGQKVSDGQYGTIGLTGTTRGGGGSVFYSRQKNKWAFSLNGQGMYNTNKGSLTDVERIQKLPTGDISTNSHSHTDIGIPMYSANTSLSYEIDSLNLITAGAGWTHFGMISEGLSSTTILGPGYEFGYDGTTYNKMTRNDISANVDFQHSSAKNRERSFIISYQFSGTPSRNNTGNTFDKQANSIYDLRDRRSDALESSMTHTIQGDFTTPVFASGHLINVGGKYLRRHNYSDQKNYLLSGGDYEYEPLGSMKYDFFNNIGSAYAEYDGKFGIVGLKVGARYEHTWQNVRYSKGDGDDFRINYGNLVPNASLQFNISRQQNVGLSYNMRISRPGITYLNPYVDISDPTALSYGNTDLKTEMAHNFNLVYNYFSQKWIMNLTLRDTYMANGISGYSFYGQDNLLHNTYGNIVQSNNIGLNAFITWMPGNRTRVIFNGGGGYNTFISKEISQENSGFDYNMMLGLQQTLPWDLRFSTNVIMSGKSVSLQGWHSGMAMGTVGLTKSILDDRLTFSLNGVTHLTKGKGMQQTTWTEGAGFTSKIVNTIPMRTLTFGVSFSFGRQDNSKVKSTRKTIENDAQLNETSLAESFGTMMQM